MLSQAIIKKIVKLKENAPNEKAIIENS